MDKEKNNKNNNKRSNSRSSLMKSGCIAAFYTLKGYFIKVKPALGIDKVVFSFVEKGTSGTGFDIYVDIDDFDLLCDSILSKELVRMLQDSSQDKAAWSYTTGEKGSKQLTIFKGNNGIVIHGYDATKKKNANVAVRYDKLTIMAKWHRRVASKYFQQMANFCIQAMEKNADYFRNHDDTPDDATAENTSNESTGNKPAQSQPQPQQKPTQAPADDNTKKTDKTNELFTLIKTSTPVLQYGSFGNFCFRGFTKANKNLTFVVTPENITAMGQNNWSAFYESAKDKKDLIFNIGYVKCKDKLLVTSIKAAS